VFNGEGFLAQIAFMPSRMHGSEMMFQKFPREKGFRAILVGTSESHFVVNEGFVIVLLVSIREFRAAFTALDRLVIFYVTR